ncbi:MAG: TraR/DksA C4-type zinc finger protein [Patescibacteria group bacterium]
MLKKNIEQFKKQLEKEKKGIEEKLKKYVGMPDFGSDVDPDQETDESEEYGNRLSVAQTYKNRLADINSALKKAKNGNYGVCEKCKKEISLDLLKVDPESRLCKECKKKNNR